MRSIKPARERGAPEYPTRAEAKTDGSRRRFLRQLAAGTGAALVGLPRLSHAQGLTVDFHKLEAHPSVDGGGVAEAERDALFEAESSDQQGVGGAHEMAAAEEVDSDSSPEAEPAEEAVVASGESGAAELVEENRALWVEPGYLVLLKWRRPADDEAPIAALEGSAAAVSALLTSRVTSVDDLHNLDRLHPLENDLRALLRGLVAPAEVDVVHLDHDCTVVCSALNPGTTYPDILHVDGEMAAPGWE